MSRSWICAKCNQPILGTQLFTRAVVPRRGPDRGVASGEVLVPKNETDCKKPQTGQ
jgi:hypothetical protein